MIKIALSREVIKCANIWIRPTHPPEQNQQWLQGWGELHPQEKAHPDSQSIGCARVVAISGNQFENLWILKWKLDEAIKMYPSKFRRGGKIIPPPPSRDKSTFNIKTSKDLTSSIVHRNYILNTRLCYKCFSSLKLLNGTI